MRSREVILEKIELLKKEIESLEAEGKRVAEGILARDEEERKAVRKEGIVRAAAVRQSGVLTIRAYQDIPKVEAQIRILQWVLEGPIQIDKG